MAIGFCVCHRTTTDPAYLPAPGAAWHYLCDKPVLPPAKDLPEAWKLATMHGTAAETMEQAAKALAEVHAAIAALDDPPEYDPDDGEAQRIADVYADARAEQDRGL